MTTIQRQEWHHKGYSWCTPIETCCLSWWCPCIVYGRTRHRIKNNGDMNGYSWYNANCAVFFGLVWLGIPCLLPMISREDIRARYHLKGNFCTDCLCAHFCGACDLAQQDKEVEFCEQLKQPLWMQPGKEGMMDYKPQQQEPHLQIPPRLSDG